MNSKQEYKSKYLKYKSKYIKLKNKLTKKIIGGECTDISGNIYIPTEDYRDPINLSNLKDYEPSE